MDSTCGWHVNACNEQLYSQSCAFIKKYKIGGIAPGSIVTCILDRENDCINFELDGQPLGVAYDDIPVGEMYVALSFEEPNTQATHID